MYHPRIARPGSQRFNDSASPNTDDFPVVWDLEVVGVYCFGECGSISNRLRRHLKAGAFVF